MEAKKEHNLSISVSAPDEANAPPDTLFGFSVTVTAKDENVLLILPKPLLEQAGEGSFDKEKVDQVLKKIGASELSHAWVHMIGMVAALAGAQQFCVNLRSLIENEMIQRAAKGEPGKE